MNIVQNTIAVVNVTLIQGDQVFLIQENKPGVRGKWNFPGGRIEAGEDIADAAWREVKEETGYSVRLTSTTGVYPFISDTGSRIVLFHFNGMVTGGSFPPAEGEIQDGKWVTLAELEAMDDADLREPATLRNIIDHMKNDELYPVDLYAGLKPEVS